MRGNSLPTVSLNLQLVLLTVLGKNSDIKSMSAEDGSEKSNGILPKSWLSKSSKIILVCGWKCSAA